MKKKRRWHYKKIGWHHWLSGHEFEQTLGDGEGQGSLACCSPWGCKEDWKTTNEMTTNISDKCYSLQSTLTFIVSYLTIIWSGHGCFLILLVREMTFRLMTHLRSQKQKLKVIWLWLIVPLPQGVRHRDEVQFHAIQKALSLTIYLCDTGVRPHGVQILVLLPLFSVTLGKSLNLPEPQFPHLSNREDTCIYFIQLLC